MVDKVELWQGFLLAFLFHPVIIVRQSSTLIFLVLFWSGQAGESKEASWRTVNTSTFTFFYIWSDYLLSRPHYGNPTAHWFLYHCFVLSCLSETLSSLSLSKHSSFLQIMCTKSDPVSILSILFLFVPSVGIHFPSPCNHYRTTLAAVLILHGMCSCVERTNHGNVQVQCSIQRLKITYWYSSHLHLDDPRGLSLVTDDPGSKPDQKYARRRDRQNYIRKNKVTFWTSSKRITQNKT